MNTAAIVRRQRAFFETGWTRDLSHRLSALRRLKRGIKDMREDIYKALSQDLGKSRAESYMSEVGMVLSEISYMEKHLLSLSRPRLVPTPLAQFPSASYILREPYGTVLIMSPWNYPFMLALEPAVDAIAAGNTVVILLPPARFLRISSPRTCRRSWRLSFREAVTLIRIYWIRNLITSSLPAARRSVGWSWKRPLRI